MAGLGDKIAGKAKEIEGKVTGDKGTEAKGKAQGTKGTAEQKVSEVKGKAKSKM